MKCSILLVLISIGGCLSNDQRECFVKVMDRNCPIRGDPPAFPETEEELKALCQFFIPLLECATSAREECGFEEDRIESLTKILPYLREICSEDNSVFKAISSNLDCIAPTIEKLNDICPGKIISEENQERLFKVQKLVMDEGVPTKCFYMIEEAACPAVAIGYFCENAELKDTVMEVTGKIINTHRQCSEEQVEKLAPVFDVYQTILLEELAREYESEEKEEEEEK